jgi:hypothetical protein
MAKTIHDTLKEILDSFESGKIPKAVAYSVFPRPDIPSARWSIYNRILMYLAGSIDARGFRQWQAVKRHVKKGSKAFYILVPRIIKKEDEGGEEAEILAGFITGPVFRVEDTEGMPLSYEKIKLPDLPLLEKAREWGILVKAVPGNYHYEGYFSQNQMEIGLASKEETVFFHELAHAAHMRIRGKLKKGQCWKQEIIAELSAAALCQIVGKNTKFLGNNYKYIEHYAKKAGTSPIRACFDVIGEVEQVLGLILNRQVPGQISDGKRFNVSGVLRVPTICH